MQTRPEEADLETRINSFELAYRMQQAAPEALDINLETQEVHDLYGIGVKECDHFAKQCLTRRMVERGVRFVQIYSGGNENARSWDGHNSISKNHGQFAGETDRPIAGLLEDLDQRGLLDSTLVVWGGEFGRLSIVQKGGTGRDHNPHAMTYWMAGGGVKGGVHYDATNEIGNEAVENRVSVNDLHATILHLCGLDHKKSSLTISMAATSDSLTSPEKSLKKSSDSRASIPNGRSEVQRDYLIKDLLPKAHTEQSSSV